MNDKITKSFYHTQEIKNHYKKIANNYNTIWYETETFTDFITDHIIKFLSLKNTDIFVDLGCGTGFILQEIDNKIGFKKEVFCVDVSKAMLEQIPSENKYKKMPIDATEFSNLSGKYDKILLKEMIHHITDKNLLISNLSSRLKPGGIILVIMHPPTLDHPLFELALQLYAKLQPHYQEILDIFTNNQFKAKVNFVTYPVSIEKSKYIQMVNDNYMSCLSKFNDSEKAKGIDEIKTKYSNISELKIEDKLIFITAQKISDNG